MPPSNPKPFAAVLHFAQSCQPNSLLDHTDFAGLLARGTTDVTTYYVRTQQRELMHHWRRAADRWVQVSAAHPLNPLARLRCKWRQWRLTRA